MAQTNEESWTNVLENAVMPVDVRKTTQVGGAAFYVALETLVDYMARRVLDGEAGRHGDRRYPRA